MRSSMLLLSRAYREQSAAHIGRAPQRQRCLTVLPCASIDLGRCLATNLERSDLTLAHDRHRYTALGFDAPQEIVTRL